MSTHIYRRIKESMYRKWFSQHQANSLAHSIEIIMPFATHEQLAYAENPPCAFFRNGYSKSGLREVLAWRISKQSACWPFRRYLRQNRAHITALITGSALCRRLLPAPMLHAEACGLLGKGRLTRLYAIALYGERCNGTDGSTCHY